MFTVEAKTGHAVGGQVPWILLGWQIGAVDPTIYAMGWQIGAVDPTTQWTGK